MKKEKQESIRDQENNISSSLLFYFSKIYIIVYSNDSLYKL
jgi:hypothetical protein